MNPIAEVLTGWTFAEVHGRPVDEVVRVEVDADEEAHWDAFQTAIETGELRRELDPITLRRRDGTFFQIKDSIAPIRTADGEVRGAVLVFSDATEQYQREQELREAREIAEEMNQLKSAFLANMSHEIRTPLTTIIGFAEIVEAETRSAAELEVAGEFAALIRRSGHRLLETINSVLDLSRLEAGTVHLHPSETDVSREVDETVNLFRPRAEDAGIRLVVEVPEAPLQAHLDPAGLHRILVNLLGNAIKFTEPEGRITVRAFAEEAHCVIEVRDTGVGIAPEFVPELFAAFQQESTGQARLHEGSGLGLAITQQLVELMGGTIEVASEKGEGTVFTVRLPQAAPESR
jgi:PAS domain S-box-containing protein